VPDPDADLLETLLATVMRLQAAHGDEASSGTALPMAEAVLLTGLLTAGEATQQQLADRLHLDKSRVSRLCSALERKGLLARERDEANRRNLRVQITPGGTAAAVRLREHWRDRHQRLLAAMTSDERDALLIGLTALVRELTASQPGTAMTAR
jgi:DNA-binding MarR family transcriptional regulator